MQFFLMWYRQKNDILGMDKILLVYTTYGKIFYISYRQPFVSMIYIQNFHMQYRQR